MKNLIKKSGRIASKLAQQTNKAAEFSAKHVKRVFVGRLDNAHRVRSRIAAWVFLMTVLIFFAGLQFVWYRSSHETRVFVGGGTYAEATIGKIDNLNPVYTTTNSEQTIRKLVFSGLYTYDTSGHIKTDLARSMEVSKDGKKYTVAIRSDVKWHDGNKLTADDVVYTVDVMKDPKTRSLLYSTWKDVYVEKIDDLTVEFTLPSSYAAFDDMLTFSIIPKHILGNTSNEHMREHDFSLNPVGTGPFVFKVVQSIGKENERVVYLSANETYHGGRPKLDRFLVHAFSNKEEVISAINTSLVSATAELTSEDQGEIKSKNIYVREASVNNGVFAFLNTKSEILKNNKVRQAVRSGIDMDAVRKKLNNVRPLDYPILANQVGFLLPEFKSSYDTKRASKLMSEAKYKVENGRIIDKDGQQVYLRLVTIKNTYYEAVATEICSQLIKMGFGVELDIIDSSVVGQDFMQTVLRPRNYDILIYEIEMGPDPDMFAYYHSSQTGQSGHNLSEYSNVVSDDLLLSARATLDNQIRKAKYEAFLKRWIADVPAIGIYQSNAAYFYNRETRTFSENNKLVSPLDRFSDVTYWASNKATKNKTP